MRRCKTVFSFIIGSILTLTPLSLRAEVKEFTLDNGLKVIISEDHKVPLATFQIWYRIGSRNEVSGESGLSHFLEHMMFKGTPKYGAKAFSKVIQKNGGIDNAMTTKDYTMYFETLSSDRIGIAIDLEADRMSNLLLDPQETLAERDVVMEERRMRYDDDPQNSLLESFVATSLMTHPYRRPVIGWMADIASFQRDELDSHYKKYYAPDNAFIVIAGDVNPEEIRKKIQSSFGAIREGRPQKTHITKEPEQLGEKRITLKKEAELPYILMGYHTPVFPGEDSPGLEVLSTILSKGKSSRIYSSLVYEKKLALNAGADYSSMNVDPFLFILWATAAPGKDIADVEKGLSAEIERSKSAPPSEMEIQKAKNQIEASFIFGQDSLYMQAMKLGLFEVIGGWRLMHAYLEGIRKVTPEDVQRVARKYLTEDNLTVGILIPKKGERVVHSH
jgi:zinc protease